VLLLALDTSAAVGAALHDGERVLAARRAYDPRRHAELLAPMIDDVLRAAGATRGDLTAVVAGTGPGPFTGLRVALVTARVLGSALGVPVHGLCSLDAVAAEAAARGIVPRESDLVVATDARRREVYWARYVVSERVATRGEGPHVGAPAGVDVEGAVCAGRGAVLYPEHLPPVPGAPLDPDPGVLGGLAAEALRGGGVPPGQLTGPDPLYLRRPDAAEPGARKRVLR
jgi:tRNA threonylcarbamoyladenosine biosynthesis protein TsaB